MKKRPIQFDGFADAHGDLVAHFADGTRVHLHRGSGRSDLFYAMKPYSVHLDRSELPSVQRRYQRLALESFLCGRPAELVIDRDGDYRARLTG